MRALGDAMGQQKSVIHRGDHVHDRIAQTRDIVFLRHVALRWRYKRNAITGRDAMFASFGRAARLIFDPAFAGIVVQGAAAHDSAVRRRVGG